MSSETYFTYFNIVLLGDSGVGKTGILFRYSDDAFKTTFISTVGIDFKLKTIDVAGKNIRLHIWDTSGQERYHAITNSYYRGANGIMLCYDITDQNSFDNITHWLAKVKDHADIDVEKMILGNKCDMEESRVVSKEHGETFAKEHGMKFLETSAKSDINIERAFYELAEAILGKRSKRDSDPIALFERVNIDRKQDSSSEPKSSSKCC